MFQKLNCIPYFNSACLFYSLRNTWCRIPFIVSSLFPNCGVSRFKRNASDQCSEMGLALWYGLFILHCVWEGSFCSPKCRSLNWNVRPFCSYKFHSAVSTISSFLVCQLFAYMRIQFISEFELLNKIYKVLYIYM